MSTIFVSVCTNVHVDPEKIHGASPGPGANVIALAAYFVDHATFFILFIVIDYPIHIDTISMEVCPLYFNGLPVKISLKSYFCP